LAKDYLFFIYLETRPWQPATLGPGIWHLKYARSAE